MYFQIEFYSFSSSDNKFTIETDNGILHTSKVFEDYMDCLQKLFALKASYPHDIILYPQDIKNLMKLPGRIPGNFDSQLLDFLKLTNGASILDYCFYGFKNNKLKIGFDENLMNKWVTFGHIAGSVIPFMSNSSGVNFGYLKDIIINGSHPIVFF